MASMLATATRTLSILLCLGKVFARSELGVIFGHTEGYNQLNSNQRSCGVSSVYSPCYGSPCRDKSCFCANPQFISDETDKCMIHYDFMYDGMYSVDTYNGIMAFFGKECGTFEVQFKQVASESITYTTGFTHPLPSTAGNVVTTSATGRPSTNSGRPELPNPSPPTNADSGENNGRNGGRLSLEAIIGIVAGCATVIATIITAYMCYYR